MKPSGKTSTASVIKMNSFLTILSFVACIIVVSATDYCSKKLCQNAKHIVCDHSGKFSKQCPSNAKMIELTEPMQKAMVDAHNAKRDKIAGGGHINHKPACKMATMRYNKELASIAAYNVKQCEMAHDACRNTETFLHSGQNLAWFGSTGDINCTEKLIAAVEGWYSEVEDTKPQYIASYPKGHSTPQIGHFTVMVADHNTDVGCAAASYTSKYNICLIACNYATTNMVNFPIYKTCDKSSTECKTGVNPKYSNLCSISEPYDVNNWFFAKNK